MKHNIISIIVLLTMLFSPHGTQAQTYSGYIDERIFLYCNYYNPDIISWTSSSPYVGVSWVSYSNECRAVIRQYFPGIVTVRAQYYYWTGSGTSKRLRGPFYQYFYIRCDQIYVTLRETSLTMTPGETHGLYYYFTPNGIGAEVSWFSSNTNVATVTNGLVKAVGPGTAVITIRTNYQTESYCTVNVEKIDPTNITLPASEQATLDAGGTQLTPTFEPSNGYSDITWTSSNTNVATVSSTGYVTPVASGTAVITATTENDLSAKTTITVSEPVFTVSSMSPANNSTGISAFAKLMVGYSLDLYEGQDFDEIKLTDGGNEVAGSVHIDGKQLYFEPTYPLDENTDYTLTIPATALENKWGTNFSSATTLHFRTGPYEKLNLATSIHGGFVNAGQQVKLTTDFESAEIRYTVDGTIPTQESALYTGPIALYQDTQLRAKAFKRGYAPSDLISEDFVMSDMDVKRMYPINERIYVYKHVNPFIEYSRDLTPSSNINSITLLKNDVTPIAHDVIVNGKIIYVVPMADFEHGCSYKVSIPADAVRNSNSEPNKACEWTFTTGNIVTFISAGQEIFASRKADGSLWTWGSVLETVNDSESEYSYQQKSEPMSFANSTQTVSAGLTHNSMLDNEGRLYMWGRQYCGEFGNGSTTSSATPILVADGVTAVSSGGQSTAILKGTDLYMCGRNDYGQIGDSTTVGKETPVKIMTNIRKCFAGYGSTYAITTTDELWAWGRNEHGELGDGTTTERHEPELIMSDVKDVAAARLGGYGAAVLKTDGSLWTLGETNTQVLSNVKTMAVASNFMLAVKDDGTLWSWPWGDTNTSSYVKSRKNRRSNAPVQILEDVDSVDCGFKSAIALKRDGSVYTWGKTPLGFNTNPERRVEGVSHSTLQGLTNCVDELQLNIGDKVVIQPFPDPLNAEFTTWNWTSTDINVATVNDHGVVEAKANGVAILKLISDNDVSTRCRVQVGYVLLGDANNDGEVNVSDIVEIVNYIMNKPSANFVLGTSDMNADGEVNVTDIIKVVSVIMSTNSSSAHLRRSAQNGIITLSGEGLEKKAMVRHSEQFTAAQFDIILADDQEIDNISLNVNSDHSLNWEMTEEGTCRVVVYSLTNSAFDVNGSELLNIRLKGVNSKIAIENVILVAADSNATDLGKITSDNSVENWYMLDGRKLKRQPSAKGVYIKNGKKLVVK